MRDCVGIGDSTFVLAIPRGSYVFFFLRRGTRGKSASDRKHDDLARPKCRWRFSDGRGGILSDFSDTFEESPVLL